MECLNKSTRKDKDPNKRQVAASLHHVAACTALYLGCLSLYVVGFGNQIQALLAALYLSHLTNLSLELPPLVGQVGALILLTGSRALEGP